jgi:anthranilate/para-aminobenzoate synthase component I
LRTLELDYIANPAQVFAGQADQPWAVFLDSGRERTPLARYDVIAFDPYLTLTTRGLRTEIRSRDASRFSDEDPLRLLRDTLGPGVETSSALPFSGGAIGYFAYDLGRRYERWPVIAADDIGLPEVAVGIYDWAVVVDHHERRSWVVGQGRDSKTFDEWQQRIVVGKSARVTRTNLGTEPCCCQRQIRIERKYVVTRQRRAFPAAVQKHSPGLIGLACKDLRRVRDVIEFQNSQFLDLWISGRRIHFNRVP